MMQVLSLRLNDPEQVRQLVDVEKQVVQEFEQLLHSLFWENLPSEQV